MEKMCRYQHRWCSDNIKNNKCLVASIRKIASLVKWTHCCMHCEVLATLPMPSKMKTVLEEAVKIANFIKNPSSKQPVIFCTS
jgi:hypothetical protein